MSSPLPDPRTTPLPTLAATLRQQAEDDLWLFAQIFCSTFLAPPSPDDPQALLPPPSYYAPLAAAMAEHSTLTLVPRGHGKTTLGIIRTLHQVCYGRVKAKLIWARRSLLRHIFRTVRTALETDELIRLVYGPQVPSRRQRGTHPWRAGHLTTRQGVTLVGTTPESAVRGGRYDELWVDDPQEDADAHSPTRSERALDFYRRALVPTLTPQGRVHITGTSLGPLSLVERLWADTSVPLHRTRLSAVVGPIFAPETGCLVGGEPLWPERFSLETLEHLRSLMGTAAWQREFQQLATDPAQERLVFADVLPPEPTTHAPRHTLGAVQLWEPPRDDLTYGIDLAAGDPAGDESAVVGVTPEGAIAVVWHGHLPQGDVARLVDDLWGQGYRGLVAPERNGALAFFDACEGYDWHPHALYRHRSVGRRGYARSTRFGFPTTRQTKPQLIATGRRHLRQHSPALPRALWGQLSRYHYDQHGRATAPHGHYDDLLMAYLIALQCVVVAG